MKTIGFVLSAPVKYSETFLLQEFELLNELGYKVIIFEGYSRTESNYKFETFKSLPNSIQSFQELSHVAGTLISLLTKKFFRCVEFIKLENKSNTSFLRILKRLWFNAHILNQKVDFLHFCFADVAIQKELAAKTIGARMSVSLRGSDILIYPKKNSKDCYNRLWGNVDKVHAVSNWIYDNAIKLDLNPHTLFQIIHDFVDSKQIEFNGSDIGSPIKIITVGRLIAIKDHEFAIEVIHYLKQLGIEAELTIIGEGPRREFLQNRISELNLTHCIRLCGRMSHEDVLKLMNKSDIYIHTSKSEGFNVSLLEAQASGLLTLSLDVGSTDENIEDGKSGWIIKERKVEKMGSQINKIIYLPREKSQEIKLYARERIEKLFDKNIRLNEWKEFFKC